MNTPDNWIILKITNIDKPFYKVLAGWSGGYLDADTWRMNSGISKVEEDENYYIFTGESGSLYKCHKESQIIRMNISGVLSQLLDKFPNSIEVVDVSEINLN